MITEVKDIKGDELHVGDYVAWGDTTSSYNAIICYGEIISIEVKNFQTHIKVHIINKGGYNYNKIKTFIYPRNYYNLIKINIF